MRSAVKTLFFLSIILFASAFLRLHDLGKVPNGLTVDEADMAYNAYSILKTGKDVYNRPLPLFFQSLDDYKPAIPIYLTIPAIHFFGLNEFSARLAPALLGSLTPVLAFFLLRIIYKNTIKPAVIGAVIFTFAPWNIAISRATFIYVELIFLYLIFLIAFFLSITKNKYWILVAAFILSLTLYTYYAALIYLPFIFLSLGFLFRKEISKVRTIVPIAAVIFLIASLPAIAHYLNPIAKTRFNAISIFTPDIALPLSLEEIQGDKEAKMPFPQLIHNRRVVYVSSFLENYFDYYNFDYLFTNAKNIRYFYVNWTGLFYFIEAPFFLFGFYKLITRRNKIDLLLVALFLVGPVPAAITLGSPFPHRGILLILAIQLIIIVGIYESFEKIPEKLKSTSCLIATALFLLSVNFYAHQYFSHSKYEFSTEDDNGAWFSTVRQAIPTVNKYKNDYDKVVFTWSRNKLVPSVYFLFDNQFNPKILQEKSKKWTNEPPSFRQIYDKIENIEFRPIDWQTDQKLTNTLFVGYPGEFKDGNIKVVDRVYLPNGKLQFILVESSSQLPLQSPR